MRWQGSSRARLSFVLLIVGSSLPLAALGDGAAGASTLPDRPGAVAGGERPAPDADEWRDRLLGEHLPTPAEVESCVKAPTEECAERVSPVVRVPLTGSGGRSTGPVDAPPAGAGPHTKGCDPLPVLADRCPTWSSWYDEELSSAWNINWNSLNAMEVAPSGDRVYVAGHSTGADAPWHAATVAFDPANGAQIWRARTDVGGLEDVFEMNDNIWDMALSPDEKTLYIAGHRYDRQVVPRMLLVAYDTETGQELWTKQFRSGGELQSIRSIAVSPDGSRVYATGISNWDPLTVAYAAEADVEAGIKAGDIMWAARWPSAMVEYTWSLALTPDGSRVIINGQSLPFRTGFGVSTNAFTVAYDAATGQQLWADVYDSPPDLVGGSSVDAAGYALAMSPDGSRVYTIGASHGEGPGVFDYDVVVVAYNTATGARTWVNKTSTIPFEGQDAPWKVAISPAGDRLYVTGATIAGLGLGMKYLTIAYDTATGTDLWTTVGTSPDRVQEVGTGVTVSKDGRTVYVTGLSEFHVTLRMDWANFLTVAYDTATGLQRWAGRYEKHPRWSDHQWEWGHVALNPVSGKVYVASSLTTRRNGVDGHNGFDWTEYGLWEYQP